MPRVVVCDISRVPTDAILGIFDEFGGINALISKKEKVFIKINAVDFRKGCYTSPEILDATIRVIKESGIKNIYVMDNSTQGNFTRLVSTLLESLRSLRKMEQSRCTLMNRKA